MKKIVCMILIVLMITLVGCGGNNSNNSDSNNFSTNVSDSKPTVSNSTETSGDTTKEDTSDSVGTVPDTIIKDDTSSASDSEKGTSSDRDRDRKDWDDKKPSQDYGYGQLTAGEWNDNKNFDFFKNVIQNNNYYHHQSTWQFVNWDRYEFYITSLNNQPIVNATIELYDEQNNLYMSSVTNNVGYAVLYPFVDKIFIQAPTVKARVIVNQNSYDFDHLSQSQNHLYTLAVNEKSYPVENLDLMFVVDTTGSMGDELEYLKTELMDVIDRVKNENANDLNIRVSGNYYRDQGDAYVVRSFPFTTKVGKVIDQMDDQSANGGGDFEEAVIEALEDAINNHQWDEDAEAKLLFLVLDAPPHQTDQNISQLHDLILDANEKGIRIIPIASSGIDKNTEFLLRFMAMNTGGTYLFLTDHSGIGNSHLEPTIGYYQVELLNELMIKVINSYVN